MSELKKHLIIYTSANEAVARQLAEELQSIGHSATLQEKKESDYSEQLGLTPVPEETAVLYLITDNFLKSYGCMNGILQATHKWGDQALLEVVVADGISTNEDGDSRSVSTQFERVGDIIKYMNFWQDKYLALRQKKRNKKQDEGLSEEIAITKEVSGDVGEFLRYVRGYGYHSIESLKEKYQPTARAEQEETVPDGAAILAPNVAGQETTAPPLPDERSLVEMIEDSSSELIAENKELENVVFEGAEINEEMLKKIPGMNLLDKQSSDSIVDDLLDEEDSDEQTGNSLEDTTFTKKEIQELDDENDELMSILDEVMVDDGVNDLPGDEEYHFVGDNPDSPGDFDIDSLFEEEEPDDESKNEVEEEATDDIAPEMPVSENEVLLNLVDEEEDLEDEKTNIILEHAVDLFREDRMEEGVDYLSQAVEAAPENTSLRYYYAYAQARYTGKFEDANKQLDILLQQDEAHPDAWFLKAEILESIQEYAGAKNAFEQVLEINPVFPDAQYRLGLLIADHFEGQEAKASDHLLIAVDQNDKNVDAHYLLATLMNEHLSQPENAVKYFRRALNLQPNHPFANYDLALLYHRLGDKQRAAEFYEKAADINPELKTDQNDKAFAWDSEVPEVETIAPLQATPVAASIVAEKEPANEEIHQSAVPEESTTVEPTDHPPLKSTSLQIAEEGTPVVQTKIVLITGATAGIGKATAELFASHGYRLILTGRRTDRLQELTDVFSKKYKTQCLHIPFDVRDLKAVNAAINELPEAWKNIDILINNAGLSRGLDPIHEGSIEDWETMIDTNVKGLLYMTRAITPHMVQRREGHIINVSSIAGTEVYPGGNVYSASKAAVSSLTRSMRIDLHKHNIRVSQISPGHVEETEFASVRFDGDANKAAKTYENFQPLKSSDIAEAIYFMATRPAHVNIQDIYLYSTQQACATMIERSGRS